MTATLNLYATKAFSEHPISLWALDDTVDYISLIDSASQNLATWNVSGATVVNAETDPSFDSDRPLVPPFPNSYVSGANEILGNGGIVTFESPFVFQPSDFNADLGSFAISSYFFTYDRTVEASLGYSYNNGIETVEVLRKTFITPERQWGAVSQTFSLPESFSDLKIIIKIEFAELLSQYQFAINGISFGQWSEEFYLESLGVVPEAIPASINIDSLGVPAKPYGIDSFNGYYLADSKKLYARNAGLPLVYGSFNSTILYPNSNKPSLIVPGFGFMNESGKYQNMTLEFWAKIQNNSFDPVRIVGPISSEDGLYVEGPFLKFKLGDYYVSHYVKEWDRPMLINLRVSSKSMSIVLNGEVVASANININDVYLPPLNDNLGNDLDWIGFYLTDLVPSMQIDCVGVYSYEVPAIVSKRRFAYGQAVDLPNNIKGLSSSNAVYIDQSFAKNSKNYLYPLLGRWSSGVSDNVILNPEKISLPAYSFPSIEFDNETFDSWLTEISSLELGSYPAMTLRPSVNWSDTNGYIFFDSLNLLSEETKAFYAIFSFRSYSLNQKILFQMINDRSGETFTAYLQDNAVNYVLKSKNVDGSFTEDLIYSATVVTDAIFMAGIHIERLTESFGYKLSRFFASKDNIKVFVGGNRDFDKTFDEKIYLIGFSNKRNTSKIIDEFLLNGFPTNFADNYSEIIVYEGGTPSDLTWDESVDGGTPETTVFDNTADGSGILILATNVLDHIATYSFLAKDELGIFSLDIGAESYWEDYVPLSYFAQYVTDAGNKKYQELDFLQFNIDYPKFNLYDVNNKYDSSGSPVKIYATFQYLVNGANKAISTFTNTEKLSRNGVVRPGSEWINTKYEITDDVIIYPPSGVAFKNLSINIHIEMVSGGINTDPIEISSMRLSSRSLGYSPNKIGNRFGTDIYPYRKVGEYFDYKNVSPFSIYKNSVPYLYLSGSGGIKVRDDFKVSDNRGLTIPMNKNFASFFKVGALQLAMKYDDAFFPDTPIQLFEIQDKTRIIRFYVVAYPGNPSRGYIFALNSITGTVEPGIIYNLDGRAVKRPTLNINRWAMIGLSFETALDMNQIVGAIRINNPISVNNISYYQITEEDEATRLAYRRWYSVRSEPDNPLDWDYWDESLWQEVLYRTEDEPRRIDPSVIYDQYTGTDRLVNQSGKSLVFNNYQYKAFKDIRWSRTTLNSA